MFTVKIDGIMIYCTNDFLDAVSIAKTAPNGTVSVVEEDNKIIFKHFTFDNQLLFSA